MKILIDNDHGIETPGKRSPDGVLREYAWNRLIATRIVDRPLSFGLDAFYILHHTISHLQAVFEGISFLPGLKWYLY